MHHYTWKDFSFSFRCFGDRTEDEHVRVLLQYTQQVRELHQQQAIDQQTQAYREWLVKASQKGCRGPLQILEER